MTHLDRRTFLRRSAAVTGGLAVAGPLQAFAARSALGQSAEGESPFGPLVNMGELSLPRGFRYKIISRQGDVMTDGNPTPGIFDGMAAFRVPGLNEGVVLIRNHENRERADEITVQVPADKIYDSATVAGNTKVVVNKNLEVVQSYAVLGGTSTNCAGGQMPWGSWVTCEEVFKDGEQPHGYCFEIPAGASGPVDPVPIKQAGRFSHEACVWFDGALYETEDRGINAALYRYVPEQNVRTPGELAQSTGVLQALKITGAPNYDTKRGRRSERRSTSNGSTSTSRILQPIPCERKPRARARRCSIAKRVCGSATGRSISIAPMQAMRASARSGSSIRLLLP
jgi:secreted PhoX family phosphatase